LHVMHSNSQQKHASSFDVRFKTLTLVARYTS